MVDCPNCGKGAKTARGLKKHLMGQVRCGGHGLSEVEAATIARDLFGHDSSGGKDFSSAVQAHQVSWRKRHIADRRWGSQNGHSRPWILDRKIWEEGLWPGIRRGSRTPLADYLEANGIEAHTGIHNLKSSWVQCSNLFFPFRQDLPLVASFLRAQVSDQIVSVKAIELEYAEAPPLDPQTVLGESTGGQRGKNQTSPDVAFLVRTIRGQGIILVENKYTEHSFYSCSGRKKKVENPDAKRCMAIGPLLKKPSSRCWQLQWQTPTRANRRYWEHLAISAAGREALTRCPAATAGYQLFRQQALAEALAKATENQDKRERLKFNLVVSAVAYDPRNEVLKGCLRATGINDFSRGWGRLFKGKSQFHSFTHQDWVSWVRDHDAERKWTNWLEFISERYDYAH